MENYGQRSLLQGDVLSRDPKDEEERPLGKAIPGQQKARTKAWRWKEKKGQHGRCRMSEKGEGREASKKGLGTPSREAKQLA